VASDRTNSVFVVLQTPVTSAPNALARCTANVPTPPLRIDDQHPLAGCLEVVAAPPGEVAAVERVPVEPGGGVAPMVVEIRPPSFSQTWIERPPSSAAGSSVDGGLELSICQRGSKCPCLRDDSIIGFARLYRH
jgi:hypothetical protein